MARSSLGRAHESQAGFIASPEEGPGLYAFDLELPPGDHLIDITSDCAVTAFVGDWRGGSGSGGATLPASGAAPLTAVYVHDALEALRPERFSFRVVLDPGESLQLQLVSRASVATARVLVREAAQPLAPTGPLAGLARFELALNQRDIAGAELQAPSSGALAAIARARLALADPSRAPERARATAKAELDLALELEPALFEARALLAHLHAEDQELDDGLRALGASEEARERTPQSCTARERWLDLAWERLSLAGPALFRVFDEPLPPLPGPCLEARLRAIEVLRMASRLDLAERLLTPLLGGGAEQPGLDPGPWRARALILAAQLALARGDWQGAVQEARAALAVGGADVFAHELLARAERLAGGPAVPRLDPERDLGLPLRSARAVLMRYLGRRSSVEPSGREVLLDDRHVRVYPDGSMRLRVHRIMRLNDVAAVEALGELPIPDEAEVLVARTWRHAHGVLSSLEPEDILEKATISLPALTPGDFVEWAYFYPIAADPRLAPGWRAPAYAFDSADGPVAEAHLTLSLAPGARSPTFVVDPRLAPPERPDGDTWVFHAHDLPPVFAEPLDPRPESRRRTLMVSSGVDRLLLAGVHEAELALASRSTPALAAFYAEAVNGLGEHADADALLTALYDAVRRLVDEPPNASPFSAEASWVADRRRGSRALLLVALCRLSGLACELVLARPLWEGPEPREPDPDGWTYALVRHLSPGRAPRWLDPGSRWLPLGLLPPALEGVFGLSLGAPGVSPPALVETPLVQATDPRADPAHWGERKVTLQLAVAPGGAAVLASGAEQLDGVFAASWRSALNAVNAEARDKMLGHLVLQALPNATLESMVVEHLEDDASPLVVRWRARTATTAKDGAAGEHGARTIQLGLMPEGLTHDTVLLPARLTPLLVNRAARMTLRLTLAAPPGWAFVSAPADVTLTYDLGRFERTSRYEDLGRTVVLDKRFLLRPGVIEPSRYAAWSEAAVAIDRADLVELTLAPLRPSPGSPP